MANHTQERSIGALFSDLTREMTDLTRQEIELAKVEMSDKASQVGSGVASLAVGGAVVFAGFLVLLWSLTVGLGEATGWSETSPWLPPLVVGLIVAIIGLIMLQAGRHNLEARNLAPRRTVSSLRKDKRFIREQTT